MKPFKIRIEYRIDIEDFAAYLSVQHTVDDYCSDQECTSDYMPDLPKSKTEAIKLLKEQLRYQGDSNMDHCRRQASIIQRHLTELFGE